LTLFNVCVNNTSGYSKRKSYTVRVEKDFEEFIELLVSGGLAEGDERTIE
jgi:hypothetical protein